jgi:hypothetical protein
MHQEEHDPEVTWVTNQGGDSKGNCQVQCGSGGYAVPLFAPLLALKLHGISWVLSYCC